MNRPQTANQAFVRRLNASIVMDCIRLCAPLSRAEVAARSGLNRSTVSSIVDELIERGFVHETTIQYERKVGRPGTLLQLNPQGGCAVGVEIGVDFISVILTNFLAEILWRQRVPSGRDEGQIRVMERAEALIGEAIDYGAQLALQPLGIGVGVPGLVDNRQGKLVYAPNLKWENMPIRLMWTRRFELPVFVENEANCGAFSEYFYGVARGVENFIYLSTGIGLGGGVVIAGKLFRGATGYGGEIGHTTIYQDGETCGCGRRGCWETYVSPPAILRRARQGLEEHPESVIADLERIDVQSIAEAARKGDLLALTVLQEVGRHLAVGITNLVNIFNPEMIVLGGALSVTSEWLIPSIQSYMQENVLPPLRVDIRVEASPQGLDACALGAVALVLDDIVREPLQTT